MYANLKMQGIVVNQVNVKIILSSLAICSLMYAILFVRWQDAYYWVLSGIGFLILLSYIIIKGMGKK